MFCPEVSAPVRPAGGHAYTPRHWKPHFADQPLRFALHTRAVT